MTLLQIFSQLFPTILEHWQETFFLKSVLLNPEVLNYRPVALEKKRQFCRSTLEFLKFQNILSLLSTFRKVSVMEVLVQQQAVGCNRAILLNGNCICFCGYFPKFLMQLFQNINMKSSVMMEFSRVLGCRLQSYILIKK